MLTLKEKAMCDPCKDTDRAVEAIREGKATMKNVLEWKKQGLYPISLIERGMAAKGLSWWPHMPAGARGRNPWFCVAYIVCAYGVTESQSRPEING
jgi:hypothetical protein